MALYPASILATAPLVTAPASAFGGGGGGFEGVVTGALLATVAMAAGLWCGWRLSRGRSPVPELPTLADVKRAFSGKELTNGQPTLAERLPPRIKP